MSYRSNVKLCGVEIQAAVVRSGGKWKYGSEAEGQRYMQHMNHITADQSDLVRLRQVLVKSRPNNALINRGSEPNHLHLAATLLLLKTFKAHKRLFFSGCC